ncbi:hypothetical protein SUDANB176_00094 [Streptomyces sp. enrichment culture]|uniref:helix-turn-helix domain-containing protein n=1 Tax=Streptomyces sp. enrichment culture TaxID=1795815 RepID=UPI003F56F2C9
MLACPSGIDLSSRALQHLSGLLAGNRRRIGSRGRRLTCGRQALLVLAHLRCGDTYARLAAGFRVGITTVHRYIREAVWADKAYQGAGPAVRVPFRGKNLRGWRRRHNRDHAKIRCLGERAMATLTCWRLLRKLCCGTTRITAVVRAVVALELGT